MNGLNPCPPIASVDDAGITLEEIKVWEKKYYITRGKYNLK